MKRYVPLRRRTALRPKKDPLKAYCWAMLRALVLHRDGYKCRWCGRGEHIDKPYATGNNIVLQVSHIKSRGAHPSMAWLIDNCLTLCKHCHLFKWHRDPQDAAAWCAANLAPEIQRKLDFTARMNGRRGASDLGLVRIALEQDVKRAGLPLPPAPRYSVPKAKRRAS